MILALAFVVLVAIIVVSVLAITGKPLPDQWWRNQ